MIFMMIFAALNGFSLSRINNHSFSGIICRTLYEAPLVKS